MALSTNRLLRWPSLLAVLGAFAWGSAAAQEQSPIFFKRAPELQGASWLNTTDGKPITLASRIGKVTVVEFWTFG